MEGVEEELKKSSDRDDESVLSHSPTRLQRVGLKGRERTRLLEGLGCFWEELVPKAGVGRGWNQGGGRVERRDPPRTNPFSSRNTKLCSFRD